MTLVVSKPAKTPKFPQYFNRSPALTLSMSQSLNSKTNDVFFLSNSIANSAVQKK